MTTPDGVLTVIPARGGSKRIPRKNLSDFRGRPLVVHSIEDALGAESVTRVVVSTDDDEIASVAQRAGAEVIVRPEELSGDTASSESALLHVLDELREREGYQPELVVFLQCTSPCRDPEDIDAAIELLMAEGADSLLSVCRFKRYVWRVESGTAVPVNYDYRHRWREQEFPEQYMENGSIYVFRPTVLREGDNRLGGRIALYEMSRSKSLQIDEPGDFAQARSL